jgi:hypothetical protein
MAFTDYIVFTGAPFPFDQQEFEAARERADDLGARYDLAIDFPKRALGLVLVG